MPDFSQPGSDGALPSGFTDWQWGVTYTVRPEILSPLISSHEYRMIATVRRKIAKGEEFTAYGDLYQRATAIANARISELTYPEDEPLYTWIQCHGWRRIDIGAVNDLLIAFLTVGLVCPKQTDAKPQGENAPAPAELMTPGGATLETLQRVNSQRIDEAYIDFDHRDLSCANPDIALFSYGEYVPASQGIDFEPFVKRAESRAIFHYNQVHGLSVIRREWFAVTNPDLAVVHVYFRV